MDISLSPRPDRSACRVFCKDSESALDMSKAVVNIIIDADDKQISTDSLSHVAAALNISVSGTRNLRFKPRVIRKHSETISSADATFNSSTSVAEFFNSFESHRKPILVSIAALHCIPVGEEATFESLRTDITRHLLSGRCSQLPGSHPAVALPDGLAFPDCGDVHNEWLESKLDADLQIHVLTAIYGSKISPNSLRRIFNNLNVQFDEQDSVGQLQTAQGLYC